MSAEIHRAVCVKKMNPSTNLYQGLFLALPLGYKILDKERERMKEERLQERNIERKKERKKEGNTMYNSYGIFNVFLLLLLL